MVLLFCVVVIFYFLKVIYRFGNFPPIERIWSSGTLTAVKKLTVPSQVALH